MKLSIMFFCTFLTTAAMATAPCNGNLEAQFIAQYDHVDQSYAEAGNVEHTTFGLKNFRFFQVNQECPLDEEQANSAVIIEMGIHAGINNGDEVSGVLVFNPTMKIFFLE